LRLLDLETALDRVATHGDTLTGAMAAVEHQSTELTVIES
jgi:hypothetical protein